MVAGMGTWRQRAPVAGKAVTGAAAATSDVGAPPRARGRPVRSTRPMMTTTTPGTTPSSRYAWLNPASVNTCGIAEVTAGRPGVEITSWNG